MKENKRGITLIALIISIIVMLILVGVTVSVSLNGGLFEKAKKAATDTQKAEEKEELTVAVAASYKAETDEVIKNELEKNLGADWSVAEAGEKYTVTSPKNNKFVVNKLGTIKEIIVLPENLKEGSEFEMDANGDGKSEKWVVLYAGTAEHLENDQIEIISKDVMGELALGKSDEEAKKKATDIDENGNVEDIEIAIYSYNNAIDRLNNYCDSLIKIDNLGVRSVGSLPSDPSYKNTIKPYEIQNLDNWADKTAWNTYGLYCEGADTNNLGDINKMKELKIYTSNVTHYWLASRSIIENSSAVSCCVDSSFDDVIANIDLLKIEDGGHTVNSSKNFGVRPIIKLQYPQN